MTAKNGPCRTQHGAKAGFNVPWMFGCFSYITIILGYLGISFALLLDNRKSVSLFYRLAEAIVTDGTLEHRQGMKGFRLCARVHRVPQDVTASARSTGTGTMLHVLTIAPHYLAVRLNHTWLGWHELYLLIISSHPLVHYCQHDDIMLPVYRIIIIPSYAQIYYILKT